MHVKQKLRQLQTRLHPLNLEGRQEAELMLTHLTGMSRAELILHGERELDAEAEAQIEQFCLRREQGEPIQYILGTAPFMGFDFFVAPGVLIPRQDTETLCEAALSFLPQGGSLLDLCTGSGCIAGAVCRLRPDARVTGTDKSAHALTIARQNAPAARMLEGDLFKALPEGEMFDVIVSNPPYIPAAEIESLQREVQMEPRMALDGGADGLDFYRRISREAGSYLLIGGSLLFEVGIGQAADVAALMQAAGFTDIALLRDLGGIDRVVHSKWNTR